MPIQDKIKPARLTELARQDGLDLYVLNNSSHARGMSSGLVIFNVAIDATDRRMVRVPPTWIPINIGMQLPKDKILASADFLDCLNRRALIGVLTKDADDIFANDEDARMEADRVAQDMGGGGQFAEMELEASSSEDAVDPELNLRIVETLSRDDMSESQEYGVVRGLVEEGSLKAKDYNYILANSKHDRVKQLATNQLSRTK
jgi:hypothetical protein